MATRLKLKFIGRGTFLEPFSASIILGDHAISANGDHFISVECADVSSLKAEVESLKSQLDKTVEKAQKKFSERRVKGK